MTLCRHACNKKAIRDGKSVGGVVGMRQREGCERLVTAWTALVRGIYCKEPESEGEAAWSEWATLCRLARHARLASHLGGNPTSKPSVL